jgi:hypothetical protein
MKTDLGTVDTYFFYIFGLKKRRIDMERQCHDEKAGIEVCANRADKDTQSPRDLILGRFGGTHTHPEEPYDQVIRQAHREISAVYEAGALAFFE